MKSLLKFVLPLFSFCIAGAQTYQPNWASLDKRSTPQWFDDAKFGIFIHWGLYSVPAWAETFHDPNRKDWKNTIHYAEWYWRLQQGDPKPGKDKGVSPYPQHHLSTYGTNFRYQDFVSGFTTQYFQPEKWADIFQKSGAKYVILTSKHHDGYSLWPSKQAWNWNSVDLNPHRDLVGDLSEAVKKAGLRMGLYYSLYEWYNPLYLDSLSAYVDQHMLPQMKDIVTKYKPELLYVDGEWDHPSKQWKSEDFLAWLYNESPVGKTIAVNDRWGKETRSVHGGYYTSEYGEVNGKETGAATTRHKWDEIRGIGRSFGYNRMEDLNDYLSSKQLIHMLVEIVSKGGNLTLNIGPTADGRIPVIMQQRLTDIGKWLKLNGEAIYGTQSYKAAAENDAVRYTRNGKNVYAIALNWPGTQLKIKQPKISASSKISLIGYDKPIKWKQAEGGLMIDLSSVSVADLTDQNAYVFKITNAE
jgi:alpha-L-fucosidase